MSTHRTAWIQDLARKWVETRQAATEPLNHVAAPETLAPFCLALIYREGCTLVPHEASDLLRVTVRMYAAIGRCPALSS